jgi:hypothetical protein
MVLLRGFQLLPYEAPSATSQFANESGKASIAVVAQEAKSFGW